MTTEQKIITPMNQQAQDLMMGSPSEVTPVQLKELHLKIELPILLIHVIRAIDER